MGSVLAVTATVLPTVAPPAFAAADTVVLNEINCSGDDWIELANPTDVAVPVAGWLLTDDALDRNPLRPDHRFLLPSGASIAAHGKLVVEQDDDGTAGFAFGISCGNDTIRLADDTGALVDSVVVASLAGGAATNGRLPDAMGAWSGTSATPGAANAAPDESQTSADSAWLFDPLSVVGISLSATPEALGDLGADPTEYVDATITITHGSTVYGPYDVGLRLKGHASFRDLNGKASFKVDFAHSQGAQRFFGLRRITLNSMVQDPSMISEAVAYELSRAVGVPAPRSGYSWVTLNGATFGLYADVETLDETWAARTFASTSHIYEGDVNNDITATLDVDAGSSTNTSDLAALAAAASTPDAGWWTTMTGVADMSEMATMWAVEHAIGHWDGYSVQAPNNYYLHSDADGRFTMIPSGIDQTPISNVTLGKVGTGLLFARCAANADCRIAYETAMAAIASWLESHELAARAAAIFAAIRDFAVADPRKEDSTAAADAAAAALGAAIDMRDEQIRTWLTQPSYSGQVSGGGGGGGSGGGGGGGEGGESVRVEPMSAPPSTAAVPANLGTDSSTPTAPPAARPTVMLAPPGAALVPQSRIVTPTASAKLAPVVSVRAGSTIAVRVRGLTAGRHRTWLQTAPAWNALGRVRIDGDGRGVTRGVGVSAAGTYLLRFDLPRGPSFVRLRVR